MKTKVLFTAAMLMSSSVSFAQFSNSGSSSSSSSTDEWNTLYLQWNPSTFSPDKGDSKSFNGFSAGFNHAFSLSQNMPLFLEAGLGVQYSVWSDDIKDYDSYSSKRNTIDLKLTMISAKVPVSLAYKYDIPNSTISIIPNAGLDLRFNISGKIKVESGDYSESFGLFDKDDMEEVGLYLFGDDDTWKRFQIGWHIGVNFMFNKSFMIGASYGTDFSEVAKKIKINTGSITLGYCF